MMLGVFHIRIETFIILDNEVVMPTGSIGYGHHERNVMFSKKLYIRR